VWSKSRMVRPSLSPRRRTTASGFRRTGEVSWEVVDANNGLAVATGLASREEALRFVRGWDEVAREYETIYRKIFEVGLK